MRHYNIIDIPKDVLEKPVYRIEQLDRLLELLRSNKLTLVSTAKWDDPFENFILNAKLIVGPSRYAFADHKRFYGCCWTRKGYSDAMWRIYSHEKKAVRLKTSIPKLGAALWRACGDRAVHSAFIGRVRYFSEKKLIQKAKSGEFSPNIADRTFPGVRSLLMKRSAFNHEREIRLLYLDRVDKAKEGLVKVDIDANDLIEGILIDPRASEDMYEEFKKRIRKSGYEGPIKKSRLYAPPPEIFVVGQKWRVRSRH